MFGFDFSQFGDMIPKLEKMVEETMASFARLESEQKRQANLLKKIAEKLGVEMEE